MTGAVAVRSTTGTWHLYAGARVEGFPNKVITRCGRAVYDKLLALTHLEPWKTTRETSYYKTMRAAFERDGFINGVSDPEAWLERIRYVIQPLCGECPWPWKEGS